MTTSIATKRKIVIDEFHDFEYPNLALGHEIAKVYKSPGNYLFEVITAKDVAEDLIENFNQQVIVSEENNHGHGDHLKLNQKKYNLASMPTKFRKTVYLIRGNFVYVEPIDGNKVKYEIVRILNRDHIKRLYQENLWPKQFSDAIDSKTSRQTSAINANSSSQSEEQKLKVILENLKVRSDDEEEDADDETDDDQLENDYYNDLMGGNPNGKRNYNYQNEEEDSSDEECEESYEDDVDDCPSDKVEEDNEDSVDDDPQLGLNRRAKGFSSEEDSYERRARDNASSDNDRF